ncbi:MAG: RNA recognition motif domain-containing protein [Phycisphaeraceae bacterium]
MITIYVGNMPYSTTEAELAELFVSFGDVLRVTIVTQRETGRSRGFGFVEMRDATEGRAAIAALAGTEPLGRPLTINEARPRGSGTGQRIIGDGTPSRNDDRHQRQDQDQPHRKSSSAIPDNASRPASAGYHNRFRATH